MLNIDLRLRYFLISLGISLGVALRVCSFSFWSYFPKKNEGPERFIKPKNWRGAMLCPKLSFNSCVRFLNLALSGQKLKLFISGSPIPLGVIDHNVQAITRHGVRLRVA
mgnify:CR=1 FL=1